MDTKIILYVSFVWFTIQNVYYIRKCYFQEKIIEAQNGINECQKEEIDNLKKIKNNV